MNKIRFYEYAEPEPKFMYEIESSVVPHIGSDIILGDKKWFVLDILITYETGYTQVDITMEEIEE